VNSPYTYRRRVGRPAKGVHDEVRFHSDKGARAKFIRRVPWSHERAVRADDILLGELASNEAKNGRVEVGEKGRIV